MIDWLIILLQWGTMSIVEQMTSAIKACNCYDGKRPFCISLQRSLRAQYFQLDIFTATCHDQHARAEIKRFITTRARHTKTLLSRVNFHA